MTWEEFIASVPESQVPSFVKVAREVALKESKTIEEVLDASLDYLREHGGVSMLDNIGKAIESHLKGSHVRGSIRQR